MLYFLVGFAGILFLIEGVFAPVRSVFLMLKASNGEFYLKVVKHDGYTLDDYLNIGFVLIGLLFLLGSLVFWIKSQYLLR